MRQNGAPKSRWMHSIRTRFIVANLTVVLLTFVGVISSQWYISKYFEKERIARDQKSAAFLVEGAIDDRITSARTLAEAIIKNPNMVKAVDRLREKGDDSLCKSIIDPLVNKMIYGVLVTDENGRVLYSLGAGRRRPSTDRPDISENLVELSQGAHPDRLVLKKRMIEYHYFLPIADHDRTIGVLDIIYFIDSQVADQISFAAGHQIAFYDQGRLLAASHPQLFWLQRRGRVVVIGDRDHVEHRQIIHIGDHQLSLAVFTDVTSIMEQRNAILWTSTGVVLGVLIIVLLVSTQLSKTVSKNLITLAQKSNIIAKGDLSARIEDKTLITEISDICTSFNAMAVSTEKAVCDLEEVNRRLTELDRLKSAFLSSVSHELRTPLTSVLGFAKLIAKDFSKNFSPLVQEHEKLSKRADRIKNNLDIIIEEGERLTRLINDVLDLSKIESGRMEYRDELFPARDFLDRAIYASRGMFAVKPDVDLMVKIPSELPVINADRDKLVQVLINLLNNAAKFTRVGHIKVEASMVHDRLLQVSVTDTGTGIPPGAVDKVFDKFHQVVTDNTLFDKPKGTGLGLSICSQIVEHYGGQIWAESELGRGSKFTFTIPVPKTRIPGSGATTAKRPILE